MITTIKQLENEIEFNIIKTLYLFKDVVNILEDKKLTDETKIKMIKEQINSLKKYNTRKFKLYKDNYLPYDLILEGEYNISLNLEEVKLRILSNILRNTSVTELTNEDLI